MFLFIIYESAVLDLLAIRPVLNSTIVDLFMYKEFKNLPFLKLFLNFYGTMILGFYFLHSLTIKNIALFRQLKNILFGMYNFIEPL